MCPIFDDVWSISCDQTFQTVYTLYKHVGCHVWVKVKHVYWNVYELCSQMSTDGKLSVDEIKKTFIKSPIPFTILFCVWGA